MKRAFIILAAAMAMPSLAFAQKAKVTQAENMLILNKTDEAKSCIEEALAHPKTKDDVKTYLVASQVYIQLAANGDAEALNKAKAAMETAITLDEQGGPEGKKKGKMLPKINESLASASGKAEGVGINAYNAHNLSLSRDAFVLASWFNSQKSDYNEMADSSLFLNVGIVCMQGEDFKTGGEYFAKAAKFKTGGHLTYLRAKYCYEQIKDSAKVESLLKEGLEAFPQEPDMINNLIQYYLTAQKNDEALVYIDAALQKDPNNAQYYFARGCLKEKDDIQSAISDYEKAIALDPNNYNSYYNLGVVYFNMGLARNTDASDERDINKYNAIKNEVKQIFSKAEGPMSKAVEVAPNKDRKLEALRTLRTIAYQIDEKKYAEVSSLIEAVQQEEAAQQAGE